MGRPHVPEYGLSLSQIDASTVDVFFCSIGGREEMSAHCREQWELSRHPWAMVDLTPERIDTTPEHFQKLRRVWAEEKARGEYYIVTDDDCLVPGGDWIMEALSIMERHPDFAILSLWPENANIHRWTPEEYDPIEDPEVLEHFSVGGVRLCRKGILTSWPVLEGKAYDNVQCEAIRKAGYRVGYFKSLKMLHLGEGRTTLR